MSLIAWTLGLTLIASFPAPDPKYLDFWVGDWDASWAEPGGKTGTGRNRIAKVMNGHVVHERFEILTGANKGFKGESWSIVDKVTQSWKQTWVDNQGGYFGLEANPSNQDTGFQRTLKNPAGREITQRMRFTQIKPEAFVWIWESTNDRGKTWSENWRIDYHRRKSGR